MKKASWRLLILAGGLFLVTGCAALAVGGAAVGAGAGTFFYVNGELETAYRAPFEKVWEASAKTVADMRGTEVVPAKDISQGTIDANIEGQKVRFTINYKTKDTTSLAIRVGILGNRPAAQRLHDKVGANLAKN